MRHNLQESERLRQRGIYENLEKVMSNEIQLNSNRLVGEEGLLARDQLRILNKQNSFSSGG